MLPLGRRLHAAGYTVSAPLLAGHGTTPEDLQHSGPDEWLLSAQAALDELVSRCEQVAVGGLSLGSALSIQLAATRPDRVRAALLMGTPFALSIPLGALLFLYTVTPAVWLWPFFPKLDEKHELRDPAFRGLNPAYPVMPMRSGRKLLSYLRTIRSLVPKVRVPSLVIHGEKDGTTLARGARRMARRLGSDQVWQLYLPRSAHMVTLDYDRERLADCVIAFLQQVL